MHIDIQRAVELIDQELHGQDKYISNVADAYQFLANLRNILTEPARQQHCECCNRMDCSGLACELEEIFNEAIKDFNQSSTSFKYKGHWVTVKPASKLSKQQLSELTSSRRVLDAMARSLP